MEDTGNGSESDLASQLTRDKRAQAAHRYLEEHDVPELLQNMVNVTLRLKPADPIEFMVTYLLQQRTARQTTDDYQPRQEGDVQQEMKLCEQHLDTLERASQVLKDRLPALWKDPKVSEEFQTRTQLTLHCIQEMLVGMPGMRRKTRRPSCNAQTDKWQNMYMGRRESRFRSLSQILKKVATEKQITDNWKNQMNYRGRDEAVAWGLHDFDLETWGGVDTFVLEREMANPLTAVFITVWGQHHLDDLSKASRREVVDFVEAIEQRYGNIPYHNRVHAAEVSLAATYFWKAIARDSRSHFGEIELLCLLLAAAVHDIAHPGFSNDYLVKTKDALAITYHEKSVLEHFHAATAFSLMQEMKVKILDHNLPSPPVARLRSRVVEMVLATDMAHQKLILERVASESEKRSRWQDFDKLLVEQLALHMADIGHPLQNFARHEEWSKRISQEFFAQGDTEKALGLEPAMLFDRTKAPSLPKGQLGFLKFVLTPVWDQLKPMLGEAAEAPDNCLKANVVEWEQQAAQEKEAAA